MGGERQIWHVCGMNGAEKQRCRARLTSTGERQSGTKHAASSLSSRGDQHPRSLGFGLMAHGDAKQGFFSLPMRPVDDVRVL